MKARAAAGGRNRRADLAAIHAAAAQLGMDTADRDPGSAYRAMLRAQAGVTSAAEADDAGRARVLAYLRRLAGPQDKPRDGWQADKIRRLWADLAAAGALQDGGDRALDAFVARMTGVSALRFMAAKDGTRVVEALKSWLARARARAATQASPEAGAAAYRPPHQGRPENDAR